MIFSKEKPNVGGLTLGFIRFSKIFVGLSATHYLLSFVFFGEPFSPDLSAMIGKLIPGTIGLVIELTVLILGLLLTLFRPFLLLQLAWAYWDETSNP